MKLTPEQYRSLNPQLLVSELPLDHSSPQDYMESTAQVIVLWNSKLSCLCWFFFVVFLNSYIHLCVHFLNHIEWAVVVKG